MNKNTNERHLAKKKLGENNWGKEQMHRYLGQCLGRPSMISINIFISVVSLNIQKKLFSDIFYLAYDLNVLKLENWINIIYEWEIGREL